MENKTGVTWQEPLGPGAAVLRGFALSGETDLLAALQGVVAQAPLRHMVTPGGYRYDPVDPVRGVNWPPMPEAFRRWRHARRRRRDSKDFNLMRAW